MSSSRLSIELSEIPPKNSQGSEREHRSQTSMERTISFSRSSTTSSESVEEIPIGEILNKPWKYIGYKGYSEFMSSESDFYILRRFGSLNARVALCLQDHLSVLEIELRDMDGRYSRRDAGKIHNGSFRDDQENQEERYELVKKIHAALTHYSSQSTPFLPCTLLQSDFFLLQIPSYYNNQSYKNTDHHSNKTSKV